MLGLQLATDPRWVDLAAISLEDILTDHAYCEQKATTTCISLIQAYPEKTRLVKELAPVAAEEWGHFRAVLQELEKRGLQLGRQRKDEYVNKLFAFQQNPPHRDGRLVERLLSMALIEARSCERFRLLSINLEDPALQRFYHKFMVSEAGHYVLFLELAYEYAPPSMDAKARWAEYLAFETEMLPTLSLRGDRIH